MTWSFWRTLLIAVLADSTLRSAFCTASSAFKTSTRVAVPTAAFVRALEREISALTTGNEISREFTQLDEYIFSLSVNDKLSDAQILRALSDCGVDYGVFWPSLSSDEVRSRVVAEMPEIAWLSLNVRSSRAHIVVHERVDKPEIVNEKAPCDIVAAKSGVIKRMSVLEGESAAVPGSAVAEGDVLVRGLMSSETGDERHVHSMAQVIADTWYEISAQTPLTEDRKTEKVHTDTAFSLIIGKKRINFFSDSRNKYTSCDKINKLRYISLGDVFTLPLGYAIESTTQYETKAVPIDEKESVERMKADLRSELQRRIGDGQIVSEEYSVSKTEGLLTVTLRAQCTENIAREARSVSTACRADCAD